jgi:hypothetical protein
MIIERPTFSNLDIKIKQRIVDFLDEVSLYDDEEDWSDDEEEEESKADAGELDGCGDTTKDGDGEEDDAVLDLAALFGPEEQRKATLSSLSQVSKGWYAVVAPVFWRVCLLSHFSSSILISHFSPSLPALPFSTSRFNDR